MANNGLFHLQNNLLGGWPLQVQEGSFLKRTLFNWGYSSKLAALEKGAPYAKVSWQP